MYIPHGCNVKCVDIFRRKSHEYFGKTAIRFPPVPACFLQRFPPNILATLVATAYIPIMPIGLGPVKPV